MRSTRLTPEQLVLSVSVGTTNTASVSQMTMALHHVQSYAWFSQLTDRFDMQPMHHISVH